MSRMPIGKSAAGQESVATWTQQADAVLLAPVTETRAAARPPQMGTTYTDKEYAALADEQQLVWPADGERDARPHVVEAEGLSTLASATDFLIAESEREVQRAQEDHQHAVRVLTPYARREPGAKIRYWVVWVLLVTADLAGVWAAAVMFGEVIYIAVWMAMGSGLAAGCAGLVGGELKDLQARRSRQCDPDSLAEDERRYRRLFVSDGAVSQTTKLIGSVSLLVVGLLAVGIFTLRVSVEGPEAALAYGLLAAATALASGLLGYASSDEVADLIATTEYRLRRAVRRHLRLAAATATRDRARAAASARSLAAEAELRGQGAAKRVESLLWRISRNNAHILGHGFPADVPAKAAEAIGRRPRRGDRS